MPPWIHFLAHTPLLIGIKTQTYFPRKQYVHSTVCMQFDYFRALLNFIHRIQLKESEVTLKLNLLKLCTTVVTNAFTWKQKYVRLERTQPFCKDDYKKISVKSCDFHFILVCCSCYNKTTQSELLKQQTFIFPCFWMLGSPKSRCLLIWFLVRGLFLAYRWLPFHCLRMVFPRGMHLEKERDPFVFPFL